MKQRYGMPYMGSKEKILDLIDYVFERERKKEYFIDLFCGGFSVSHYALLNSSFKVFSNDLNKYVIAFYKELLFNKSKEFLKVKYDFITKEIFTSVKNHPEKYPDWYVGYVLTLWSFGNSQKAYMYSKENEAIKHKCHDFLMQNGYREDKSLRIGLIKKFKNDNKIKTRLELQSLESLQRLERLERLESLQSLDYLDFLKTIPEKILEKSFIYCDIPYQDTAEYQMGGFNHSKFWDWFRNFEFPVYTSSYKAPPDIKLINFKYRKSKLCSGYSKKISSENIYFNNKGVPERTLLDLLFN